MTKTTAVLLRFSIEAVSDDQTWILLALYVETSTCCHFLEAEMGIDQLVLTKGVSKIYPCLLHYIYPEKIVHDNAFIFWICLENVQKRGPV